MKAQKETEKRHSRSYKCTDKAYKKAMRRAKKEKTTLANIVELVVFGYGNGINFYGVTDAAQESVNN